MEDCLAAALADVDDHTVVLEAFVACGVADEVEHALGLVRRKLTDLSEGGDVPLGNDEQMRVSARVDVTDGDEAVSLAHVIALADEIAEEAVVRQRESPPPRRPRRARARARPRVHRRATASSRRRSRDR